MSLESGIRDPVSGKNLFRIPDPDPQHCFMQCFGTALVSMRSGSSFLPNEDPNPDPSSQTNVDPDPGQTLPSQKVDFDRKNIGNGGNMS